ncbi:uncharacterized protein LOC135468994 [Liolophura sinensis]|uniref:uncharacterized protein LOC135468994 n=1 Tax=Liolophura sinensis TaxID=3198878 RepID=UPI003158345C
MGVNVTKRVKVTFNDPKEVVRVTPIMFSRVDTDSLLRTAPVGAYLLYVDFDTDKLYLSVRSSETVEHHRILEMDGLYYLDKQPYPYLDSVVLYHRRHKLKGTRLTQQAYLSAKAVKQFSLKVAARNGNVPIT